MEENNGGRRVVTLPTGVTMTVTGDERALDVLADAACARSAEAGAPSSPIRFAPDGQRSIKAGYQRQLLPVTSNYHDRHAPQATTLSFATIAGTADNIDAHVAIVLEVCAAFNVS